MRGGQSPNRKRPCSGTLDGSSLETNKQEINSEGIEQPDSLTNKKPRQVFFKLTSYFTC